MSEYEVREFEKNDYLEQCVNLRHWDEEAKDPNKQCPPFSYFRSLIKAQLISNI